jgi:peroxiredoxin
LNKATVQRFGIVLLSIIAAIGLGAVALGQPIASFTAHAGAQSSSGLSVVLDASGSQDASAPIVAYQWLFGDGFTGSGETVTHSYSAAGNYAVTLMLFDKQGKSGSTTVTIHVASDGTVTTPGSSSSAPPATQGATQTPTVTAQRANLPVGIKVGDVAPEFTLHDPSGKAVSLSDFLGHVVILDFWRSTCPACQSALPNLESIYEKYKDKGLEVVSISLDPSAQNGQTYLSHNGYTGFVDLWNAPTQNPVYKVYGVTSIPFAYVIDQHGVIRYKGSLERLTDTDIQPWL